MPTGYTSSISDNDISLEQFIWRCSHAFVRDECDRLSNSPPSPQKPSDYYDKKIAEMQDELDRIIGLDQDGYEKYRDEYNSNVHSHLIKRNMENGKLRSKYMDMYKKVESWNCSERYRNLKAMALSQLRKSIDHDCFEIKEPLRSDLKKTYLNDEIDHLKNEIDRLIATKEKQKRNYKNKIDWINGLKEELKNV